MTPPDDAMLMRTIIDLPEAERGLLDAQCRQQVPQSTSVFRLWRDRADDALQLQQVLREEWER